MKKLYSFLAVVFLASMMASCSSDSTSSNNNNNNNNGNNTAGQDTMIVTIDGTTHIWHAVAIKTTSGSNTSYNISGIDDLTGTSVGIDINNVTATGTYTTGVISPLLLLTYNYFDVSSNSTSYGASFGTGNGTLIITQLTPNFKATFSGSLNRINGTNGGATASITNGSVNVTVH